MDTIVRYLAIEEYFGKNDFGFELYAKMQKNRGAKEGYVERFRTLIASVEQNGFDPYSFLPISKSGYLVDGSHRLALALYFDEPFIPVKFRTKNLEIYYGIKWFEQKGFTADELEIIKSKQKEIFYNRGVLSSDRLDSSTKNV